LRQQRPRGGVSDGSREHDQDRGRYSGEPVQLQAGAGDAHHRADPGAHRGQRGIPGSRARDQDHRYENRELHGVISEVQRRGSQASYEGGADCVPQGGGRQVRLIPRRAAGALPGRAGDDASWRAAGDEDPLRDADVREGARDASPRAAHDDAAHDRTGPAPDTENAGADGPDAGLAAAPGGAAVRYANAAAVVAFVVAGILARPSTGSAPPEPVEGQSTSPFSHEYADVNGVRLHYARAGNGPLIVFLHGFPEFWYEWKNQLVEFSRDHTAVAPDMRGYNLSSKPADPSAYQVPQLVEDVRALTSELMKSTGGSTFSLVAHDWGGVVAWVFAALHPDMLDKLVIVNAPHPTIFGKLLQKDPAQQKASGYMLMLRGPQAEETLSANSYAMLTSMVLGDGLKAGTVTEADKAAYVEAWSQPGALTGGLNYYRAAGVGPPTAASTASTETGSAPPAAPPALPPLVVRVPTLVIWGEKDTALLTANLDGLDEVVTKLTIRRVPDGTHWVVREKPAEVNRLIREFLAPP